MGGRKDALLRPFMYLAPRRVGMMLEILILISLSIRTRLIIVGRNLLSMGQKSYV